jgi:hypothetical protein
MTLSSTLICPYSTSQINCKECVKVEKQWNIKRVIEDLTQAKCQHLTKSEICWLRLLIYGLSPEEIAQKLSLANSHIKSALSTSIYRYVENLTGRKLKKYSQVRLFLQEAEKYEKIEFELEIGKEIKLSDIDPELLMYTVKKLGIQFPVEFIVVKIPGNENNES